MAVMSLGGRSPSGMTAAAGREDWWHKRPRRRRLRKAGRSAARDPDHSTSTGPPQDRWTELEGRAQDVQLMAMEEVSARDTGWTGTLVITVAPRSRRAAWLRDRRDRPTRLAADECGGFGGRHRHLYDRGAERQPARGGG